MIRWRWTLRRRLGAILILTAVALIGLYEFSWRWDMRAPLDAPIALTSGTTQQWHLVPNVTGQYEVALMVYRGDADGPDSALGMVLRYATAEDSVAASEVDVSWELAESNGRALYGRAKGRNAGWWSRGKTGRVLFIAEMTGRRGYTLRLHMNKPAPTLENLPVSIRVQRHPADFEGWGVIGLATWALGIALAIAGLIAIALPTR